MPRLATRCVQCIEWYGRMLELITCTWLFSQPQKQRKLAPYNNPLYSIKLADSKGLSTAEGGRGHVTTYMYMYCVTIKIQTLRPDILKIVHKYLELYDVREELWS